MNFPRLVLKMHPMLEPDVNMATLLLSSRVYAEPRDENRQTPLNNSTENSNVVMAKLLLDSGADIEVKVVNAAL